MNTPRLVIVDGLRTPFCKMGSDLAALGADELGRIATQALLTRTGLDPALIDEVIFGCVGQPADAANVARVIALRAGIPEHVPAITVHRNCASGLEALTQAYEKMTAGRGSIFLVGGAESMSNYPLLYTKTAAEKFAKLGRAKSFGEKAAALAAFQSLVNESPDLARLVKSPVFSADEQVRAIGAVLKKAEITGVAANFIRLVASKRRLYVLSDMIDARHRRG